MGEDELVHLHGGLVTAAEAMATGWTRSRLKRSLDAGRLIRLRQGVYTAAGRWESAGRRERHQLVLRAHQRLNPAVAGRGLSAIAALGLPLPAEVEADPVARRPDLLRLTPGDVAIRVGRGPKLASLPQIVADAARLLPIEWALAVADAAVFRGLITVDELRTAELRPGVPGAAAARWVLDRVRARVESPLESLARAAIILGGFPEPVPQQLVPTARGIYRVDLLDAEARVIVEADGKGKYGSTRFRSDRHDDPVWDEKLRADALQRRGFAVVRFVMADYYARSPFLAEYAAARNRRP